MPTTPSSSLTKHIAELYQDAQACAVAAGLSYVSDAEPGIKRRRHGRGFSYRDTANRALTDARFKARILELAIPPAWTNVWICPEENGHIMAVGEDDRGRKQYIYHQRWRALRDLLNFYRLISFGEHLPAVRAFVNAQLRRRTLDRERVLAAMLRLIDVSGVRIGNEVYAEENESLGLTTLTKKHVSVNASRVRMAFPAKSGKYADIVVEDAQVARVVSQLRAGRGRRLFTLDGEAIDSAAVNAMLERLTGEHITAKDFRTWTATHVAFAYLEEHANGERDPEQIALQAIDAAAGLLGNTRAVARAHYVHPHVLDAFTSGTFGDYLQRARPKRQPLLAPSERRLLAFLNVALESDLNAAVLRGARA